jgi:hypothetical protein
LLAGFLRGARRASIRPQCSAKAEAQKNRWKTAMIPRVIGFPGGAGANASLASGAGSVQGGVVGGIAVAVPVGGIQTRGLPSTEVTVAANDVTGVRSWYLREILNHM